MLQQLDLIKYSVLTVYNSSFDLLQFWIILGSWAKQILVILNKNYPSELRGAVHQFLEVCWLTGLSLFIIYIYIYFKKFFILFLPSFIFSF